MNKISHKALSVFGLAMINVIAIDSLRNLATNATYGGQIVSLYIIGAIGFLLPCALITAMLATRHPKTGGTYIWVKAAFGEQWGLVAIWMLWVYNIVWFPTILSFIAVNIAYLFDPSLAENKLFIVPMVIGLFLLASWINNRGIRTASWLSSFGAIIGTLLPMAFLIALGAWWLLSQRPIAISLNLQSILPHIHHLSDLSFMTIIVFSLIGIEMSAIHAGDVKNPRRDYPRALLISCILILATCILASLAVALIVPKSNLNLLGGLDQALALFLNTPSLHWLFIVAVLAVVIGSFAGMAAWTLGPARSMMIAANDGCAPKWLARVNKKGAPSRMLALQCVIVAALALMFLAFKGITAFYATLAILSSQLALLYYVIFFATGLKLGLKKAEGDYFKIPCGRLGLWLVSLLGLFTCISVIALGFFEASVLQSINIFYYDLMLLVGIIIFISPPFIIYQYKKRRQLL